MSKNRHQALGLTDQEAVDMYRTMLLARKIDERMWLLNRSGKIPFVISCQGQEAAQVGAAFALDREMDYVLPYYRDMGVVLAFGMTAKDLMMSGFAKAADPNSGRPPDAGTFRTKGKPYCDGVISSYNASAARSRHCACGTDGEKGYRSLCYIRGRIFKPRRFP